MDWWRLAELFSTLAPEEEKQRTRIRFMERQTGLPVKSTLFLILLYQLFFTDWFTDSDTIRQAVFSTIQWFYLFCLAANIAVGTILVRMDEVSTFVLREVVFAICLLDAALLAMLTEITGGFDSFLFWMFLGLLIRNAVSIPLPSTQIIANLLVSLIYLLAALFDVFIASIEEEPEVPATEPFLLRALMLVLMTACCYGVQVLFDKQRRMEAETEEFNRRQELLQASGRLAAEIAHQLKNPLGIINNAAFSLQQAAGAQSEQKQQIQIIREEVGRSDQIITKLMGYAQLVEGRLDKLDVNHELDKAIHQVFPQGSGFAIQVERHYAATLPTLMAQPEHISEIFSNLLQNAREAVDNQGLVTITTRYGGDYSIEVCISDNGSGIPPEQVENIFEPYYTTKEKGTGLGLAIVKHNIELYGGSIHLESELGKGCHFTLRFPGRTAIRLLE